MKIRLYLAEDSMSHALVRGLRARGVDVATALEEGMVERADEAHFVFAAKANRTLYSFNVGDFTIFTVNSSPKTENTQDSFSAASNNSPLANSYAAFSGSSRKCQPKR